MAKKKKSDKNFGWTSNKSWNRTDKTHEEKNESAHYSFKLPKKAKPKKIWCQPGDLNTTVRGKREGQKGRPYGYKPIYDADQIYNYQSNSARLNKALSLQPELVVGRILFYRASNDCYWHVVIPPDLTHEELRDNLCELPPDFFDLVGEEFWLNYPRPVPPTPGQPLFVDCPEIVGPDYEEPDNPGRPNRPNRPPTLGCMDLTADNFNPAATIDDGSCEWEDDKPPDEFCPNGYSKVCKDSYTGDICQQRTSGCTDPEAINFDDCASYEDGSCEYLEEGCTDPIACNYDPNAQVDNGTCVYPVCWPPCDQEDRTPIPLDEITGNCSESYILSCENDDPCEECGAEPGECIRQPKNDCLWTTTSKEKALGGGGCVREDRVFHTIDHGYAIYYSPNGETIYSVLCCTPVPDPIITYTYWIKQGDETRAVTKDELFSICCEETDENTTWYAIDGEGNVLESGTGCPKISNLCPGFNEEKAKNPCECDPIEWEKIGDCSQECNQVARVPNSGELPDCPPPNTPLTYQWSFVELGFDLGTLLFNTPFALKGGTNNYWISQANASNPGLYPPPGFGGYSITSGSEYGVSYQHVVLDRSWPTSQGDQISIVTQFFLSASTPEIPLPSVDFRNAYPGAPWRLVSVTGNNFSSTSEEGFDNQVFCDPRENNRYPSKEACESTIVFDANCAGGDSPEIGPFPVTKCFSASWEWTGPNPRFINPNGDPFVTIGYTFSFCLSPGETTSFVVENIIVDSCRVGEVSTFEASCCLSQAGAEVVSFPCYELPSFPLGFRRSSKKFGVVLRRRTNTSSGSFDRDIYNVIGGYWSERAYPTYCSNPAQCDPLFGPFSMPDPYSIPGQMATADFSSFRVTVTPMN